jgi:hypothetical protein
MAAHVGAWIGGYWPLGHSLNGHTVFKPFMSPNGKSTLEPDLLRSSQAVYIVARLHLYLHSRQKHRSRRSSLAGEEKT